MKKMKMMMKKKMKKKKTKKEASPKPRELTQINKNEINSPLFNELELNTSQVTHLTQLTCNCNHVT